MNRIPFERAVLAYWMAKRGFTMTFGCRTGTYTFSNGEDENDWVAILAESDGYRYIRNNEITEGLGSKALYNHIKETI